MKIQTEDILTIIVDLSERIRSKEIILDSAQEREFRDMAGCLNLPIDEKMD